VWLTVRASRERAERTDMRRYDLRDPDRGGFDEATETSDYSKGPGSRDVL